MCIRDSSTSACLVHADIMDDNVITDGKQIAGLIDFGDAMATVPEFDLAWRYSYTEEDNAWNAFLEGYGTEFNRKKFVLYGCLLYTSPSPRDLSTSRMPSSA
eukprot:TRINITY_DN20035_c0_g1_i1.p4 TRINITY_DN20035_c0_g1~~TRINITY_DN20035_c0_g1_i1.p4  ORF type:complete len:115 (+),score=57.19 TRINITY_DN20035_c0_g1_i1:42-347(+)